MYPSNAYVIRQANEDDQHALQRLAELDGQRPFAGPALIGEIDGRPAAALDLDTGRTIPDPFRPTAALLFHLRVRAAGLEAHAPRPGVADRIRHALTRTRVVPA